MRILNIVTSPRKERSTSIAITDSFLFEYQKKIKGLVVDKLDVWTETLPEFGAEAIDAKMQLRRSAFFRECCRNSSWHRSPFNGLFAIASQKYSAERYNNQLSH